VSAAVVKAEREVESAASAWRPRGTDTETTPRRRTSDE